MSQNQGVSQGDDFVRDGQNLLDSDSDSANDRLEDEEMLTYNLKTLSGLDKKLSVGNVDGNGNTSQSESDASPLAKSSKRQ